MEGVDPDMETEDAFGLNFGSGSGFRASVFLGFGVYASGNGL